MRAVRKARSGNPFNTSALRHRAHARWKNVGLTPIGSHATRRTCTSLMTAAAENAEARNTYVDRASISGTYNRDRHLMPGSEDEVAALLE
jgi:hypothetical protein